MTKYRYTDGDGDELRIASDESDVFVAVQQGRHTTTVAIPHGETPDLARAVLDAAGYTGHIAFSKQEHEDDQRTIRTLYQQRADLRARVRDVEAVAESMRERSAALTDEDDTARAAEIRALPLLPDGDEPKKSGRVGWLEIDGKQVYPAPADAWGRLKDELPRLIGRERVKDIPHDSEYATALHDVLTAMKRIENNSPLLPDSDSEGTTWPVDDSEECTTPDCACSSQDRTTSSYDPPAPRHAAAPEEGFDAGWVSGVEHARSEHEHRISELEKLTSDLSALVHGHGEDIGQAKAAIRGLKTGRTAPRPYTSEQDG